MASKGECEFAEDVATELPLIGILELLGVPLDDRKRFFEWTNTMIFVDDPDTSISEEEGQPASNESIRTVIAQGMRLLMEHLKQLRYLVANPDKISHACKEILRYNTAFISMRRIAVEDTELGGQKIQKGDKVAITLPCCQPRRVRVWRRRHGI